MASPEETIHSPTLILMHGDADVVVVNEVHEDEDHHPHHHLSRLSMCTSHSSKGSSSANDEDEEMRLSMSRLSMEDGDEADGELSDKGGVPSLVSSDSEKEPRYFSLPPTPPPTRKINRQGLLLNQTLKEYASENEVHFHKRNQRRRRSNTSISFRERWIERAWSSEKKKYRAVTTEDEMNTINNSGESECLVITRPKGGKRSLCMDLEEVKACKELGFELESDMMLELPGGVSMSCSSSGGNSPIASWKISSPGDDPRDVKARLKVWAQAVAIASTNNR